MFKRLLGSICAFAIIMTQMPVINVVAAPSPVASFDASVYEGTAYEKTTNGTTITVKPGVKPDGSAAGTIEKRTFTNGKGEEVSYLVISDTSNIDGGVDVPNKVSVKSDGFGGNITAELWVQYTASAWRNFLGVMPYDADGKKISNQLMDLKTNTATQLLFKGAGNDSTVASSSQNDKWLQIVMTKEYNATKTSATCKYYCNGVLISTATKPISDYVEECGAEIYVGAPTIDTDLTTGNRWIIDKCIVSRINAYSGALSADDIAALYKASKYDFSEQVPDAPAYTGPLAKVDYSKYTEGSYTYSQLQDLDENITYGSKGIYGIESTIAGNTLKVQSQNASGYREGSAKINLSQEMTHGRIVTDVTMKMYGSGLFRYPYRISGEKADGTSKILTTIRYDLGFKYDDGSGRGITSPKLDGYGFYQLSFVLTAKDAESDWKLEMYDKMGDITKPLCTIDIARANLSKVLAIITGGTYCNTDDQTLQSINIKDVNIYATAIGGVSEVSDFDSKTNSVKATFTTPIGDIPEIVYAESLTGNTAVANVKKGEDDKELIFSFPFGLPDDSDYTISFDKIPYKDSNLVFSSEVSFTADKTDVSLYNVSMTDQDGNSVTNLDGITELNFDYDWKSEIDAYFLASAVRKDGLLLNIASKNISNGSGSGEFTFDLEKVEEVKLFVLCKDGFRPLFKNTVIGYSPEGERVETPLSISGGFFNGDNQNISYIKNQEGISAKAQLYATNPPENMKAIVSVERDGEISDVASEDITFTEETASVKVSLDDYTPAENDKLIFTIKDNSKTYFTKWLFYEDLSKTVDILLIAGQSNAEGHMGNAEESIKSEPNTVYLNTFGNNTLSTEGIKGWAGSLGKTWHDRTGHTVIVIRAAAGGTGFADGKWIESGACYINAKNLYRNAVASVRSKTGYEIGDCVYFWLQGENEQSSWTAQQYKDAFLTLHKGFTEDFGTGTDDKLTHCGILPIRSGSGDFPNNLKATGVRSALYDLAAENDDITMVSSYTEYLNCDEAVMNWFGNKYKNLHYPTGDIPLVMYNVFKDDNVHYAQKGYNELGYEAADNTLDFMNNNKTVEGVSILSSVGIKNYKDGDDIILPKEDSIVTIYPTASAKKVEYSLSDNISASLSEYGVLTPKKAFANSYSTLTVKADGKEMTFKVYSPLLDESITIASVKDNKKAIYTFTGDDGTLSDTIFYHDEFKRIGEANNIEMTGTIALVPGWIESGKAGIATWKECENIFADGILVAANHTMNHNLNTFVNNADGITDEILETEVNKSREMIMEKLPGQKVLGLVLPGNWAYSKIVTKAKEQHKSIRSGAGYTSLPIDNADDLYGIHFQSLMDETTATTMNSWVDSAINNGKWLMEMWHGVRDGADNNPNSQGYAPNKAEATAHFEYIASRADSIWVANWNQGICYMMERLSAKVSMLSQTTTELKIELKDDLDNAVYNEELTVNIKLPEGWTDFVATQGDKTLTSSVYNGNMSINIVPDSGVVTITKKL